jgi:predicted transposase/invertase (TIGR01784 family)
MQFLDVKTDIAFKKVFGSEQHKDILIGFLNAVLDLQGDKRIVEVTLKNPWQPPDLSILKETILDIKAVDNRGVSFIVEMQVKGKHAFQKRAQYYTAKAYTSQIDKGEDYPKLGQVIFIGILNFNCFEGSDFLTRHLILNLATQRQELKDIEFNFIELTKFNKTEEQLQGIVDKWIYFIKNADNLTMIPQSAAAIPELNNAYTQASILTWTKDELDIYEYWRMEETSDRYKLEEEFEKGIEKGIEKGRTEERLENVRKMKQLGVAVEIIIQVTGLSREEIEE